MLTMFYTLCSPGSQMGGTKSKPKDPGQRSLSLDGTIGMGSGSGHHLMPGPQTQTPNRSPAVGTNRRGTQPQAHSAELALFGGVDHCSTITSPHRGPLSGKMSLHSLRSLWW